MMNQVLRLASLSRSRFPTTKGFSSSLRSSHNLSLSTLSHQLCSSSPTPTATTTLRFKSTATATYDQSVDSFPSIVIGPDRSIEPQGSFAEAQAQVCNVLLFIQKTTVREKDEERERERESCMSSSLEFHRFSLASSVLIPQNFLLLFSHA
jgi:hypothetical protein